MALKAHRKMMKQDIEPAPFERVMKSAGRPSNYLIAFCGLIFALTLAHPLIALGSSQTPDDYIRADFTVEDGLPDNVVNAIVQTGNGLLWVGTASGKRC